MPKGQKPRSSLSIIVALVAGMPLAQAEEAIEVAKEVLRVRKAGTGAASAGKPGPKKVVDVGAASTAVNAATGSAIAPVGVIIKPKKSHHKKKGAAAVTEATAGTSAPASTSGPAPAPVTPVGTPTPGLEELSPEVAAIVGAGSSS